MMMDPNAMTYVPVHRLDNARDMRTFCTFVFVPPPMFPVSSVWRDSSNFLISFRLKRFQIRIKPITKITLWPPKYLISVLVGTCNIC